MPDNTLDLDGLAKLREEMRGLLEADPNYEELMSARRRLQKRIEEGREKLEARRADRGGERQRVAAYGDEEELAAYDAETDRADVLLEQLEALFQELSVRARRMEEERALGVVHEISSNLEADAAAVEEARATFREAGRQLMERATTLAQLVPKLSAKGVAIQIEGETLDRVEAALASVPGASVSLDSLRQRAADESSDRAVVIQGETIILRGDWPEDAARVEAAKHPDRKVLMEEAS